MANIFEQFDEAFSRWSTHATRGKLCQSDKPDANDPPESKDEG